MQVERKAKNKFSYFGFAEKNDRASTSLSDRVIDFTFDANDGLKIARHSIFLFTLFF